MMVQTSSFVLWSSARCRSLSAMCAKFLASQCCSNSSLSSNARTYVVFYLYCCRVLKLLWLLQDEKNPSARWCPRAGCDELIICDSNVNFTCPKCKAVGCFQCRGFAHRFWFCRAQVDPSYLAWEKSVGQWNAVRGCPRCRMRIWKSEGCNHMTCTHCRHQYCWVCGSNWEPRYVTLKKRCYWEMIKIVLAVV